MSAFDDIKRKIEQNVEVSELEFAIYLFVKNCVSRDSKISRRSLEIMIQRLLKTEAERDALKEFAENIKETIELHESHWRFRIEKDLAELDAALKAGAK